MLTPPTPELLNFLMEEALKEASRAATAGEVPVGAVVARAGNIIGRGHNLTEARGSVSAHAEMSAIDQAAQTLGGWRLSECVLCVTLEPCTMCLGAIRLARVPLLAFGAGDSRQGAVGSLYDLSQDSRLGDPIRVIRNIKQNASEEILTQFFKRRRGS